MSLNYTGNAVARFNAIPMNIIVNATRDKAIQVANVSAGNISARLGFPDHQLIYLMLNVSNFMYSGICK